MCSECQPRPITDSGSRGYLTPEFSPGRIDAVSPLRACGRQRSSPLERRSGSRPLKSMFRCQDAGVCSGSRLDNVQAAKDSSVRFEWHVASSPGHLQSWVPEPPTRRLSRVHRRLRPSTRWPSPTLDQVGQLAVALSAQLTQVPSIDVEPAIAVALQKIAAATKVDICQLIEFSGSGQSQSCSPTAGAGTEGLKLPSPVSRGVARPAAATRGHRFYLASQRPSPEGAGLVGPTPASGRRIFCSCAV